MPTQVLKLVVDMVNADFIFDPQTGHIQADADFITDTQVPSFKDTTPLITMKVVFPKGSSETLRLQKRFTLTIDEGDDINSPPVAMTLTAGTPVPK